MTGTAAGRMPRGIFLVGCPRSGTTLLQSLIAAHPLVTSFSESNFFGSSFRKLPKCAVYYAISDPARQKFLIGSEFRNRDDLALPPRGSRRVRMSRRAQNVTGGNAALRCNVFLCPVKHFPRNADVIA